MSTPSDGTQLLELAVQTYLESIRPDYQRVKSWKRIAVSLRAVVLFIGTGAAVNALDLDRVEEFKRIRLRTLKPVSVRHDMINLGLFVRYARRRGWIQADPMEGVKIPSDKDAVHIRVLTEEEERRYLDAARSNEKLYAQARIILANGMRPGEVQFLRVGDFNRSASSISIRSGKSRAARRTLKVVGEVADLVGELAGKRPPGEFLFRGRFPDRPMAMMNNAHHNACKRAGLVDDLGHRDIRIYDFRHTFATRMAGRGMPLTTLAAILGHSGLRCVLCYVHPNQAQMDDALAKFAA